MTFTIPRLTPGGLLSVRLSPASPGAFPQIPIRLVALLRLPPDSGASPCTRLSPAPRWGVLPRVLPPIRHLAYAGFSSLLGAFPQQGASHFGVCSASGLGGFGSGSPLAYSPLSLASRARLPVSPTMDSATWGRWWFAAIPTALCGSQLGEEVSQVDSSRPSSMPM